MGLLLDAQGKLIQHWSPRVLDHSWGGWILLFAYVAASVLCLRNGRRFYPANPGGWAGYWTAIRGAFGRGGRPLGDREETRRLLGGAARAWLLVWAGLLVLGVNRLFHLEDWVTVTLRNQAVVHGWYNERRGWQFDFLLAVGVTLAFAAASTVTLGRGLARPVGLRVAVAGGCLLLGLAAVRTSSFHYSDAFLDARISGLPVGGLIELALLSFVTAGAIAPVEARR